MNETGIDADALKPTMTIEIPKVGNAAGDNVTAPIVNALLRVLPRRNALRVGDVVNMDDYRHGYAYIVTNVIKGSGHYEIDIIQNEDVKSSGYLDIPFEVTKKLKTTDAYKYYANSGQPRARHPLTAKGVSYLHGDYISTITLGPNDVKIRNLGRHRLEWLKEKMAAGSIYVHITPQDGDDIVVYTPKKLLWRDDEDTIDDKTIDLIYEKFNTRSPPRPTKAPAPKPTRAARATKAIAAAFKAVAAAVKSRRPAK